MKKALTFNGIRTKIQAEMKNLTKQMNALRESSSSRLADQVIKTVGMALIEELPQLLHVEAQFSTWQTLLSRLEEGELTEERQRENLRALATTVKRLRVNACDEMPGNSVSTSAMFNIAVAIRHRACLQVVGEEKWLWEELQRQGVTS